MDSLRPCPQCHRHLRADASACPFCERRFAPLVRAALPLLAAVALTGCPTPGTMYAGPPPTPEEQAGEVPEGGQAGEDGQAREDGGGPELGPEEEPQVEAEPEAEPEAEG